MGIFRKIPIFILIFFAFTFSAGAEEIPLALDEAIALALRDNRNIRLKAEDVKKAKEKIREAKAGLFPALNFTGNWTRTRGLYAKDINQITTQTTLKQYLYKGAKTVNTIRQRKYEFEVSQALLDKEKLETILKVREAFYAFLLSREFAGLNKGILKNSAIHLDFIRERFKSGEASESGVLNAQASLGNVRYAYEASLNQAEEARALLNNLLYLDENNKIRPDAAFSYEPLELAYDEAFLKAVSSRPEIRQYEAQKEADKRAVEAVKSDNRPSIYASWDYFSRSTTSLTFSPNKNWQDYEILGLTFSWPVFDGWQTRAKVEQAIVDLKKSELLREKAIRDIALELKQAYLGLKSAIAGIKSAGAQAKLYRDTLLVAQDKHKAGIASGLDLDDASLGYEVSLFNEKEAVYDYLIARAGFDKAAGGL